ncbi:MAG: PLP-dependent aminotransferase family protein [Candidatus Methylacidiphilales bacterium]|nr:PLP-dependent aminotransferase family protein [Candidatus Methylacidiphilales bacterium]
MRSVERPGWINLGAGVPSPKLLPVAALQKSFVRAGAKNGLAMWAYQRPEGHAGLREALAERLRNRKVRVGASEVLVTNGCTQALHLALALHTRRGGVVACESPCYYNLLEQIHAVGARSLSLPGDPVRGLDADRIAPWLEQWRPDCLVVCSTLSNPGCATIPVRCRAALVDLCRQLGVRLIEDDIYGELREGGALPPLRSYDDGSTVTYVSSTCKSVAPGLRGGLMLPGDHFEQAVRRKCMSDLHGPTVAESTLAAFLESGGMEPHLERLRAACHRRRARLRKAVVRYFPAGTRVSDPEGGFLLWVECPGRVDPGRLHQEAAKRGVSFAPGEIFFDRASPNTCMRLNAARAEESELERGAGLMSEAWAACV